MSSASPASLLANFLHISIINSSGEGFFHTVDS